MPLVYIIGRMCQENPPKIKEKRKEILNRRKLLLRKDLGEAACPADVSRWGIRT
jgi:hypothetical protein